MHILLVRAISSAGRASRLHRDGRQFESVIAHHFLVLNPFEEYSYENKH